MPRSDEEIARIAAGKSVVKKLDPRPARGMWAPGNYISECTRCRDLFEGDKRARHCADCAYALDAPTARSRDDADLAQRLDNAAVSIGLPWTAEHRQHVFDTLKEAASALRSRRLLPCPFCGGNAIELACPGGSFVQCQTCKASSNDSNAVESWNRRTARSQPEAAAGSDEDSAYELGKRDGYEEAVQEIDVRTGGDGEFYGSTIPGRGQDVQSMLEGIVERFEELNSRLQPAAAEAPSSAERVTPSEVEDLVERQRTKLAELAEFAEIPRGLFKEVIDLQLKIAHALASLSLRVRALEEAAIQANGFLKDRFLKDGAFIDGAAQLASNYLSEAIRARTALHGSEGGNAG